MELQNGNINVHVLMLAHCPGTLTTHFYKFNIEKSNRAEDKHGGTYDHHYTDNRKNENLRLRLHINGLTKGVSLLMRSLAILSV